MPYHMCNLARVVSLNSSMQCHLDMGIYGIDSPKRLIDEVFDHLYRAEKETDTIIINGDFSAHGTSIKLKHGIPTEEDIQKAWSNMKHLMKTSLDDLRELFPDAAILPSIGNNDVVIHNQVPCTDSEFRKQYYEEMFDIWFPAGKISNTINYDFIKESFLEGGYYAHEFPNSNLTFIALNSIMFIGHNKCDHDGAMKQIEWLHKLFERY